MNLREALDADLIGFDGYGNVTLPREAFEAVHAAARRFLALTETGPDYEAAREALWLELDWDTQPEGYDGAMSIPEIADKIVDAALADYLTEEDREP